MTHIIFKKYFHNIATFLKYNSCENISIDTSIISIFNVDDIVGLITNGNQLKFAFYDISLGMNY